MTDPSELIDEDRRDSRVGAVFADRYRIDELVDRGAMGRVYVGQHTLMRKRVAIKVLHRELTAVPEFVTRFEREAMAAANIDSDHVVAATDFGKLPDGSVFLVLEYVVGTNLRDVIEKGPMPVERALVITRQLASALKSAHSLGIVHRDLKPENIMLVEKAGDPDFVKVLDFGIARVPMGEQVTGRPPAKNPITKAGMVFGTPEYMPPEQALGQTVDERADIYSLGVVLYELLSGKRPFSGDSQVGVLGRQLAEAAPPFAVRVPGLSIPDRVERFVLRCLEREASARPQTAAEVLDAIDELLGHPPGRKRSFTLKGGTRLDAAGAVQDPSYEDLAPLPAIPTQGFIAWCEALRPKLPAPLRRWPLPALLAVPGGALSILAGIGLVSALGGAHESKPLDPVVPGTEAAQQSQDPASTRSATQASQAVAAAVAKPEPAPAPDPQAVAPKRAPRADLESATANGIEDLRKLGAEYPEDAQIPLAMSGLYLAKREFAGAVGSLAKAIELDPTLKNDKQIASALWITVQNRTSSVKAFELLEGPMGERGERILKDLVRTQGIREDIKQRARRALQQG